MDEGDRGCFIEEQFEGRLATVGTGAFIEVILGTNTSRVEAADIWEDIFTELGVERTASVGHTERTISVVFRLEDCVLILGGVIDHTHTAIEAVTEVLWAIDAEEVEIVLH